MKQKSFSFVVEPGEPIRVDKFLDQKLPEISRSQIKLFIEAGNVTVDGDFIQKAGEKVKSGSTISVLVTEKESQSLLPERFPLEVIYEDGNVIVLNKPAGTVVHPGAGNLTGTLVNGLLAYYPPIREVGDKERPGVVHRLDKETSGVLAFAKTNKAYKYLIKQFKSREINKTYLALVDGHPPTPTGRIEAPIERDSKFRTKMKVGMSGQGKDAITEYFELQRFERYSYLEVHPITGRTHQIRVHLSYIGVPIVGDVLYGHRRPSISLGRYFLHAKSLSCKLPGDRVQTTFDAPLPVDLQAVINDLMNKNRNMG